MSLVYMLKYYIIGAMFLVLFLAFLQTVGGKFCKKAKRFTTKLILGYIIYTAGMSVGAILIRLFELDWNFFVAYMVVLWLALSIYSIDWKNLSISSVKEKLVSHIKQYYPLYIISLLVLGMGLLDLKGLWGFNRMDDGWYITQISQLPKMGSVYTINPPTGFTYEPNIMRIVNTYEMEAAFYSSIMHIPATIFVKAILAYFHYFLLCTCVSEFSSMVFKKENKQVLCSMTAIVLILFAFHETMLHEDSLLILEDHWQFNTAMGYGSSIVRTMGIFLLILPVIQKPLFSKKTIIYLLIVSFALVSKASQALPIVYLAGASLFLYWLLEKGKDKKGILSIILIILLCLFCIPVIGEEAQKIVPAIYQVFTDNFARTGYIIIPYLVCFSLVSVLPKTKNMRTAFLIIGIALGLGLQSILFIAILIFIYGWQLSNGFLRKWNSLLLIMLGLMFIPGINHLFIDLSVYDFVAQRAITLVLSTLIITSFVTLIEIALQHEITYKKIMLVTLSFGIMTSSFFIITYQKGFNLVHAIAMLKNNAQLVPNDTLILGDRLSELSKKYNSPVNVVMPMTFVFDGIASYPFVMLRLNHMDINVLSAVARYGEDDEKSVSSYTFKEQTVINQLNTAGISMSEYEKDLAEILKKYPKVDTFVVTNPLFKDLLTKKFAFHLVEEYEQQDKDAIIYILHS